MNVTDSRNKDLLERVNASGGWFHARKVTGLWARRIEAPEEVESIEGALRADAGDYLCRGVEGEFWPQSAAGLLYKYEPTEEVDREGFRRYDVKDTEESHVMAARLDAPVVLKTQWGDMAGGEGDFLVKFHAARDEAFPEVWIVSASVFAKTYARVEDD